MRLRGLRMARVAVFVDQRLKYNLSYALRELGLAHVGVGRVERGLKHIRRSCAFAMKRQKKFEYAESLLVCGRLSEKLGNPDARQENEAAEELLAEFDKQLKEASRNVIEHMGLDKAPEVSVEA